MRIVMLPKYGPLAASTRYRFLQYRPALEAAGLAVEVWPLVEDQNLARRFQSGAYRARGIIASYWRRAVRVLREDRGAVIVFNYELFPYVPAGVERMLLRGRRYVIDFDDATFHTYDQHPRLLLRWLLRGKVARLIHGATHVVCGNEYLAAYARPHCARVSVIPTVIDPRRYGVSRPARAGSEVVIGWIGSPSTAAYLQVAAGALSRITRPGGVRLVLVGSGDVTLAGLAAERRPWREDTERADLADFDIGIMPVPDTPWARGKCGFKLLQYMATALPVVASPVGVNRQIVQHGVNGFLASSEEEWTRALERLTADPSLRARMGAAGRELVTRDFSLDRMAPRWVALLAEVGGISLPRAPAEAP